MLWLENVKNNLVEEITNPPITPCGSSNGSIEQCSYLGQTVFVYTPTILPCDVGRQVRDCEGNLVFSFGGFCNGPCPGNDQVQFLENCEQIFAVPDHLICDNSCNESNALQLEFACLSTDGISDQVCVPLIVKNFINGYSFQGGITWDTNVLMYSGINEVALSPITINASNALMGSIRFLWLLGFTDSPLDLIDDTILFEICFDVVGNLGSLSTVELVDVPNLILELAIIDDTGDLSAAPLCTESGQVSIGTADITLDNISLDVIFCNFEVIPTLGQWAIFSLFILFLIIGVLSIKDYHQSVLKSN